MGSIYEGKIKQKKKYGLQVKYTMDLNNNKSLFISGQLLSGSARPSILEGYWSSNFSWDIGVILRGINLEILVEI